MGREPMSALAASGSPGFAQLRKNVTELVIRDTYGVADAHIENMEVGNY